jgi:hemerythrin-like domain-containing protein
VTIQTNPVLEKPTAPAQQEQPQEKTGGDNPILQLLREHDAFRLICDELSGLLDKFEASGHRATVATADYAILLKARETIREHLNVHLVKEEEIFFPRLEKLVPQGRVKFLYLNYDHEYLRQYFNEFCDAISDFEHERDPAHRTIERLVDCGRAITYNLVQHILAEDSVYFKLAHEGFDEIELRQIGLEMDALESRLREH